MGYTAVQEQRNDKALLQCTWLAIGCLLPARAVTSKQRVSTTASKRIFRVHENVRRQVSVKFIYGNALSVGGEASWHAILQ